MTDHFLSLSRSHSSFIRSHTRQVLASAIFLALFLAANLFPATAQTSINTSKNRFKPNEVLIKFKSAETDGAMAAIHGKIGGKLKKKFRKIGWQQVLLPPGVSVEQALAFYKKFLNIEAAQPNYQLHALATPNDPRYGSQWDMTKIGAPTAWNSTTGSSNVVVAVIDTGVDYNHPDLQANMWRNPGEIASNGKDDDGNGYIDDVYGIDTANGDGNPLDDQNHGTHCAGTIGAVGNNGVGVSGVNWNVKIMALKFLDNTGSGYDSDAIACLEYAIAMRQRGVNLVATSNSWGGSGYSTAMKNAFDAAYNAGIINVCAAGNSGVNNDGTNPDYPASYNSAGIISVAASDSTDARADFSNYGATSVDLAAPGVNILSTLRNNAYGYSSGTSMATPHVAGAIGLLAAYKGGLSAAQLKQTILNSVDVLPQWQGYVLTSGRLNIAKALNGSSSDPPPTPVNRQADLLIRNASENIAAASGDNIYNATGTNQTRSQTIGSGATAAFRVAVQNDGEQSEALVVTAPATSSGWTLAYFDASNINISSAITGSGWTTPSLAAGASIEIEARITASSPTTNSRTVLVTAASSIDRTKKDVVSATATLLLPPDLSIRTGSETDAQYATDNVYQSTPSGAQIKSVSAATGTKATFKIKLQNDTKTTRNFVLKAGESAANLAAWSLAYKNSGGTNVTSQLRSTAGRASKSLAAGASEIYTVEATPLANKGLAVGDSISIDFKAFTDATDVTGNTVRDSVRAVVTVPPPLVVGVDVLARNFGEINFIGSGVINTSGTNQTVAQNALRNQLATYYVRFTNTGNADDKFKLKGDKGDSYRKVKYLNDETSSDLTSPITGGSWTSPLLAPGQSFNLRIEVTPSKSTPLNSSKSFLVTATSTKNTTKKDTVKIVNTVVASITAQSTQSETVPANSGLPEEEEQGYRVDATLNGKEVRLNFGGAGLFLIEADATNVLRYTISVDGEFTVPTKIRYIKSTGEVAITLPAKPQSDVLVQWNELATQTGDAISGDALIEVQR